MAPVKTVTCLDLYLGFVANLSKKLLPELFLCLQSSWLKHDNNYGFSLYRMKTLWTLSSFRGPLWCRWSGSTGCSIAVGSCSNETLGEDGTLPPMACQTKAQWMPTAPQGEAVGSGEQCTPATGPNSSSTKWPPGATKATPSGPPSTACWLSSPWTFSSSFTGQAVTVVSEVKIHMTVNCKWEFEM